MYHYQMFSETVLVTFGYLKQSIHILRGWGWWFKKNTTHEMVFITAN